MNFETASVMEQVVWGMKLADYPRAQNRARINGLFNGNPPYTEDEEKANNIAINVNSLEGTKLAHDARNQFSNAFTKPGNFFTCRTDMGPQHKRSERGAIVTRNINRIMKRSLAYYECQRSKFAMNVLHGIGPSGWDNCQIWCPDPIGIEDVLVPSNTLLTMKNLPFFAIFRSYTAEELYRKTHGALVDPGWQMPVVEEALKWADDQARTLMGSTWPQVWSPEKMEERIKQDSGLFASDAVPTIDAWDVYYWNDDKKESGWRRKMILDANGQPGVGGAAATMSGNNIIGKGNQFLYDGKAKVYGSKIGEVLHFQFADLSAVAPFRYHSVRSLGFLLYAVCHLQNRLRCKFNEAVFEGLMMYMRVKSLDEAERALKIELISRGIIDETVQFVPPQERWQVNEALAQMGLAENTRIISENSSSYVQNQDFGGNPSTEKTKFQVQAELNATTALISAALLQAYTYQTFEYNEIFRRFCIPDSRDPDVRDFQKQCLKAGVPLKMLVAEAWDQEPERVMGAGNKTNELNIAQTLMSWRSLYDPESQRLVLRQATLAVTDDPALTNSLVPENPNKISDAAHDAQLASGTLLMGLPVGMKTGINHIDYVEALLVTMATIVKKVESKGGMATEDELVGLKNIGQHIGQHIQIIAQDKEEAQRVRQYADDLGNLMNMVKAYEQRLEEAKQKAAEQQGGAQGMDPKDQAKLQAQVVSAKIKAKASEDSHAQKTAQRQVSWQADEKRKEEQHQLEIQRGTQLHQAEIAAVDVSTAADITRENTRLKETKVAPKKKAE
jgi:hypothetical protein